MAVPFSTPFGVNWGVLTYLVCRYGFITFETEEEAAKVYTKVRNLKLGSSFFVTVFMLSVRFS